MKTRKFKYYRTQANAIFNSCNKCAYKPLGKVKLAVNCLS